MATLLPASLLQTHTARADLLARLVSTDAALSLLDLHALARLAASDSAAPLADSLLAPAEQTQFARFRHPKRRLEWLGGRLAAKHCLDQLAARGRIAPRSPHEHPILPDAHGRPCLHVGGQTASPVHLSISHSSDHAAALACLGSACGLDLERASQRLVTVQARFTSPEEIAVLHALSAPLTRLAVIWTVKEAVKKCWLADHPTFLSRIHLVGVAIEPGDPLATVQCRVDGLQGLQVVVRVALLGDYVLACTEEERHA